MKTAVSLATLLLFVSIATNAGAGRGDFNPGSEPDGFRGIKWGTNVKTLKGMTKIGTDTSHGEVDRYIRKGEKLQLSDAQLSKIIYYFWRQQFLSVTIEATGISNCMALRKATVEKFRPDFQGNQFIERCGWSGSITSMMYDYNTINDDCSLYMSSKKGHEETDQYNRQKAQEGAEKSF